MAPMIPITVAATAIHFPLIFLDKDSLEIPADHASKNVVVTVENTIINYPAIPSPAFTMICAISDSPVKIEIPIPITYIQQLTNP